MKRLFFLFFVMLLSSIKMFSFDVTNDTTNDVVLSIFGKDEIKKVVNGDILSRMYIKFNAKGENTHSKVDIKKTKYVSEDFSKYEILCDEMAFIPYDLTADTKLKLYNTLLNYKGLSGMDYYSRSANKVEKLIINAYNINNPKDRMKVDVTASDKIELDQENYYFQEDNKFGKLIFKSRLINDMDNFILISTNEDPIVSIMKINNQGDYKIITYLIYDKFYNGYFYYSINAMRVLPEFLLKNGFLRPTTFSNRLRAALIHLFKQIGIDKQDKLNPWDEKKLKNGEYFVN